MALAFDSARWEALAAAADTRGSRRRHCLGARAARPNRCHFVRGWFPRSGDVPARASRLAPAGVRGSRGVHRLPVRADARRRGRVGRARRSSRASAGPSARGGRTADHERRNRGARARSGNRSSIRQTWSSSRLRPTSARSSRSAASRRNSCRSPSTRTVLTSRNWSSGSPTASGQSSSTRFRIIRTRPASASQPIAARRSSSSRASTASW